MQVTYTAPNRSHHYPYAQALSGAGVLHAFVSGFPRLSSRAGLPELGSRLVRRDLVQLVYCASLRTPGFPPVGQSVLADVSKRYLDVSSYRHAAKSDIFLAYNGCGLSTFRKLRGTRTLRVVEVVNSHVETQEGLLREEHERLSLEFQPFYEPEKCRRLAEYEEADYILCPSEFVRKSFLDKGFSAGKLLKNRYGMARASPSVRGRNFEKNRFRILFVGSLSLRKGVCHLVEAFQKLDLAGKELWLVGPQSGPSGLERMELPANVLITGTLKGRALNEAYEEADVFVLPSIEEGLALVMGEALSFGIPIVATTHTGAEDLFRDGVEGFVVPIRDPGAIVEKLEQLAGDLTLRTRMSAAAAARAENLDGWAESGSALVNTLRGLLE